tara:strand:+ start:5240 stop:5965 length:726 start_codon:yes stop_codon:yes gene_type:complete
MARFLNSSATEPISKAFNGPYGGTMVFVFKTNSTTAYTNQYLMQGGWGGGWNWLFWQYPWSGSNFNLRFRQHRDVGNYGGWSCRNNSSQYNFTIGNWYYVGITYNNSSTSNDPTFSFGDYSGSSLTHISSPHEEKAPQGSPRVMTAHYAGFVGGRTGNNPRPWSGNLQFSAMWDKGLPTAAHDDMFNGGAPYDMSQVAPPNLLYFHDMASVSNNVVTPHTGGSTFNLTLENGATTSTQVPS